MPGFGIANDDLSSQAAAQTALLGAEATDDRSSTTQTQSLTAASTINNFESIHLTQAANTIATANQNHRGRLLNQSNGQSRTQPIAIAGPASLVVDMAGVPGANSAQSIVQHHSSAMAAQIPSSIEEMVLGGGGPESASHINMLA